MDIKSLFISGTIIVLGIIWMGLFNVPDTLGNPYQENDLDLKENPIEESNQLSLVMVGDALIHGSLYKEAKRINDQYDFAYIFEHFKDYFHQYDLAFYNQESIIGGKELGFSAYPRFNTPKEFADLMVEMGFNLVSLANNHSFDKGEKGLLNSNKYWKDQPVLAAGTYSSVEERGMPRVKMMNNISYSLLSYTVPTNGLSAPKGKEYLVNVFNYDLVAKDIEKVRDKVDLLIVSMHWGVEYVNYPNLEQKKIAEFLASKGVDIVIGHHPHVLQPIEIIDGTLIFYSLGNFVSAQNTNDRLTGMIASLNIKKENNRLNFSDLEVRLIYTYHRNFKNFKLYPYEKLNYQLFFDYENFYLKYKNILTSLNNEVFVFSLDG
ncbi:MAG: CapA family protein [Bacilli bacterium]|jgi:poly-gamma-glutamate capsule biosynthesis protein CapA/YwtB (metallophosphatase superfamily)